ncbi:MAG: electron transport complex subunit E [Desulfotomaculaceae bacterium]|nr:electron transport complex subunit E [Desulfotomaculaceae bacterium]
MDKLSLLKNGIIKENPVLILLLGTCPTLAVTTSAVNGLGMGVSTMAVLIGSNIVIALLKNIIPDKVRIPSFIVVIAGFVTIVGMLLQGYAPEINESLGLFIPLIVVNCIILGRAEMFASKNKVADAAFDGIGMGLGFTFALFLMGSIRELIGSGAWMGINLTADLIDPMSVFMLAPGAFFTYGCLVALINYLTEGKAIKKKEFGCEGCATAANCQQIGKGGCA